MAQFPGPLLDFAEQFIFMQSEREKADYDPNAEFSRLLTLHLVGESRRKMEAFNAAPKSERRAFAAHALLRAR